jgi:hypothetical protein
MKANRQTPGGDLRTLKESSLLRIRAGKKHRFIGIWHVVAEDRVFVRSWSVKERGWYRTFFPEAGAKKSDPHGAIQLKKHEIAVVAKRVTDKKLLNAIDRAYLEKYKTPGALKYVKDLCSAKSRATTVELVATQPATSKEKRNQKTKPHLRNKSVALKR